MIDYLCISSPQVCGKKENYKKKKGMSEKNWNNQWIPGAPERRQSQEAAINNLREKGRAPG